MLDKPSHPARFIFIVPIRSAAIGFETARYHFETPAPFPVAASTIQVSVSPTTVPHGPSCLNLRRLESAMTHFVSSPTILKPAR